MKPLDGAVSVDVGTIPMRVIVLLKLMAQTACGTPIGVIVMKRVAGIIQIQQHAMPATPLQAAPASGILARGAGAKKTDVGIMRPRRSAMPQVEGALGTPNGITATRRAAGTILMRRAVMQMRPAIGALHLGAGAKR